MEYLDRTGLAHLWSNVKRVLAVKQDKLTGTAGHVVWFDGAGSAAAGPEWSNPNLLDNWYFLDPIDQQKRTVCGVRYGIDRYITDGIQPAAGGMRATKTGAYLLQRLDHGLKRFLSGKTVTASCILNGKLCSGTLCYEPVLAEQRYFFVGCDVHIVNTVDGGILFWSAGKDNVMSAAKLELGLNQTLAHQDEDGAWVLNDPPPDKALELAKCQRYYQIFTDRALRPTRAADFRPPMRVDPALGTIDIGGTTYYTADANL